MFKAIGKMWAQRRFDRELIAAKTLTKNGGWEQSRKLAGSLLRRCRGLKDVSVSEGRCCALIAECFRREGDSILRGLDKVKLARAIPYYARAVELLRPVEGMTMEVQLLILNQAGILNRLQRYQESIPLWELLLTDDRNKKSHGIYFDYGLALREAGRGDEALAALRVNYELERADLAQEIFDEPANAFSLSGIGYFKGPLLLSTILVERQAYDEALEILVWMLTWTERPGRGGDEFDPMRDRVRQLLSWCMWGIGRDADGYQQQRLELVLDKPRTVELVGRVVNTVDHVERVVVSIWEFFKKRDQEKRFFDLVAKFKERFSGKVSALIYGLKVVMLTGAKLYDEALVAVGLEKAYTPPAEQSAVLGKELAILVLAGRADHANGAASRLLGLGSDADAPKQDPEFKPV